MTIVASADYYSAVSDTRTCNASPGVGVRSRWKDVQAAFLHSRTLHPAVDGFRRRPDGADAAVGLQDGHEHQRHSTLPANTARQKMSFMSAPDQSDLAVLDIRGPGGRGFARIADALSFVAVDVV